MAFVKNVAKFAAVLGIVYVLMCIPVTQKLIFSGPLKPMWQLAEQWCSPLAVADLTKKLNDRNQEIIALKKELLALQVPSTAAHTKNGLVNARIAKKPAQRVVPVVAAAPTATPAAVALSGVVGGSDAPLVQMTPSPDESQTAAYWASMEAENAAAVAQKLDPSETARIFLAMKPDQVAEIMNALPADYNVKLQAVHLSYAKPIL